MTGKTHSEKLLSQRGERWRARERTERGSSWALGLPSQNELLMGHILLACQGAQAVWGPSALAGDTALFSCNGLFLWDRGFGRVWVLNRFSIIKYLRTMRLWKNLLQHKNEVAGVREQLERARESTGKRAHGEQWETKHEEGEFTSGENQRSQYH